MSVVKVDVEEVREWVCGCVAGRLGGWAGQVVVDAMCAASVRVSVTGCCFCVEGVGY